MRDWYLGALEAASEGVETAKAVCGCSNPVHALTLQTEYTQRYAQKCWEQQETLVRDFYKLVSDGTAVNTNWWLRSGESMVKSKPRSPSVKNAKA